MREYRTQEESGIEERKREREREEKESENEREIARLLRERKHRQTER